MYHVSHKSCYLDYLLFLQYYRKRSMLFFDCPNQMLVML